MKKEDIVINHDKIQFEKSKMSKRDWKTLIRLFNLPTEKEGFTITKIVIPEKKMGCEAIIDDFAKEKLDIVNNPEIINAIKDDMEE